MELRNYPPWNQQFAPENRPGPERKFHLPTSNHPFSEAMLVLYTWRIIPISKWSVIPMYKPFSLFEKGEQPQPSYLKGTLLTMAPGMIQIGRVSLPIPRASDPTCSWPEPRALPPLGDPVTAAVPPRRKPQGVPGPPSPPPLLAPRMKEPWGRFNSCSYINAWICWIMGVDDGMIC